MNRNELLKRLVNKPEEITVEGYGTFKVKGMSTADYLYAAAQSASGVSENAEEAEVDQDAYFAALVVRCTLDEHGKRIFKDEDITELKAGDAGFMLPLALEIQRLSGSLNTEADVKKG